MIRKFKKKLSDWFLQEDGGKMVLNKKRLSSTGIFLFITFIGNELITPIFKSNIPHGGMTKSDMPFVKDSKVAESTTPTGNDNQGNIGGVLDSIPPPKKKVVARPPVHILYKGKQVFYPDSSSERIPTGAKFIGKLLTSIDTRSQQGVHVILPYGGSHKSGGGSFPPDTILMGQFNYTGQDERVFLVFNRAVLPEGREIPIHAQALSSKDYQVGLIGDYHSNKGSKMASALGLSMVGGISEVMVEKEGFGQGNGYAPKATIRNGLYNGVAKITEAEATEQAAELGQSPKYVTIDSGADMIISLEGGVNTSERQEQTNRE
jgi:hypothetical protein